MLKPAVVFDGRRLLDKDKMDTIDLKYYEI